MSRDMWTAALLVGILIALTFLSGCASLDAYSRVYQKKVLCECCEKGK